MERFKIKEDIMIDPSTVKEMEDEVFSNLRALKYLKTLGMSDDVIKNNISKIYDFALDMKNCKDCLGLDHCNKEPKHLVNSVTYRNGVVDRNLIPCKKYLEFANFKKRLVAYDFPEEWLTISLTKDVSNLRSKAKTEIIQKYKRVLGGETHAWIFIKGGIATGKSFFAAALAVEAAKSKTFESIAFMNVPKTFKELSDLAFTKNPQFDEKLDLYKNADFLVIDDFGNEFKSDFVRDNILFPILSHRVRERLFTIITSNYSMSDCASMYQTSNVSKPKIEQIRTMLDSMCGNEIILNEPAHR